MKEKFARKISEDPQQEALRQDKSDWNKDVSLLIAQLIAFKRGLNGRGEPRAGLPPSNIKNPFPPEIPTYLEQLATRYQEVINDANNIINKQYEYSKNRRKSKKELEGIQAHLENEFIKNASWWGTRAWAYIKNYGNPKTWIFDKKDIKDRMFILRSSVNLIKNLKDVENSLVSRDDNAIPNAVYSYLTYSIGFDKLLASRINKIVARHAKDFLNEQKGETSNQSGNTNRTEEFGNSSEDFEGEEEYISLSGDPKDFLQNKTEDQSQNATDIDFDKIDLIQRDIIESFGLVNIFSVLEKDTLDLKKRLNKIKRLADSVKLRYASGKLLQNLEKAVSLKNDYIELLNSHSNLINYLASELQVSSTKDLAELVLIGNEIIKKKAFEQNDQILIFAHSFISRWLNRQRLKLFPSTQEKLRLQAVQNLIKIINNFDKFQDVIEKSESSIDDLTSSLGTIAQSCKDFSDELYDLAKDHNFEYEQSRLDGKTKLRLVSETNLRRLKQTSDQFQKISDSMKREDFQE